MPDPNRIFAPLMGISEQLDGGRQLMIAYSICQP